MPRQLHTPQLHKPSEETLRSLLEVQWQDHFQTRAQTWKGLEITAILTVALVGLDWRVDSPVVTVVTAALVLLVAQFGVLITLQHRKVEVRSFEIIVSIEEQLGASHPNFKVPLPLSWKSIFDIRLSNTPLFILRLYFAIQLFALIYLLARLYQLTPLPI